MCAAHSGFAFFNESDRNYKVFVSALLTAKASGSEVTIYSSSTGAYCHIDYITVT